MLAGALFNRATDIFTSIVDLAAKGVETTPDNELMRECEECFVEALKLGKTVKHYSGHEGIDELWGEPLKAFSMSMADCYESRYAKIAQTMRDIDRVADAIVEQIEEDEWLCGARSLVLAFARAAKDETETMRTDVATFDVWPEFVACGERLYDFRPQGSIPSDERVQRRVEDGLRLLREGANLLTYLAGARVPMPKSTREFLDLCRRYRNTDRSASDPCRGAGCRMIPLGRVHIRMVRVPAERACRDVRFASAAIDGEWCGSGIRVRPPRQARYRPDEPAGIGVLRRVAHSLRRTQLDNLSLVHHRGGVAQVFDHPDIVSDEEQRERSLAAQVEQQLQHLGLHRDVEGAGHLVAHHEVGTQAERAGDADALALAPESSCGYRHRCSRSSCTSTSVRAAVSSRSSGFSPRPCAAIGSVRAVATVRRGLSDEAGSWKTNCRRRRMGRMSRRPRPVSSRPSKCT